MSVLNEFPVSLQTAIYNIIKEEGYVKYSIRKDRDRTEGHFLGEISEIGINGETAEGAKETPLFVKRQVTLEKIKLASVADVYSRELFVYNDLSRLFKRLQDDAKVSEEERFQFVKSYESDSETIILENLAKRGFKTYPRQHAIQKKFAEISVMALAKIHSLSFVTKNKYPNYFEEKIRTLNHPYNCDSDWSGFLLNVCDISSKVLKGEIGNKVKNYAPRLINAFHNLVNANEPVNGCLCHGDYKILNILVKEENAELIEIYPIDYQLIYYGCPMNDFFFYIFTGTDQAFRKQHLSYLKDLYYETFSKFLKYFEMDAEATYSKSEFEKDYKERLELGLVFGLIVAGFTFVHFDERFDVTKLSLSELPIVPDDIFEGRVRGIVEDYIEWGYL